MYCDLCLNFRSIKVFPFSINLSSPTINCSRGLPKMTIIMKWVLLTLCAVIIQSNFTNLYANEFMNDNRINFGYICLKINPVPSCPIYLFGITDIPCTPKLSKQSISFSFLLSLFHIILMMIKLYFFWKVMHHSDAHSRFYFIFLIS